MLEELAPAARGEALATALASGRRLGRPLQAPLADTLAADAELRRDRREADAGPRQALQQPGVGVASVAIVEGGDLTIARRQQRTDRRDRGWRRYLGKGGRQRIGVMVRSKRKRAGNAVRPRPSDGYEMCQRNLGFVDDESIRAHGQRYRG